MMLQPCSTVELTKIHYYDKNRRDANVEISTISREVRENNFNKNVIIKKNVFGHRWVLKINEREDDVKKKTKWRLVVYILVFCSIIIAVGFGIFFSLHKHVVGSTNSKIPLNVTQIETGRPFIYKSHENQVRATTPTDRNGTIVKEEHVFSKNVDNITLCRGCVPSEEVCLKLQETDVPKCVRIVDRTDPTGCGGLCRINTQFCQILDVKRRVYQCSPLKNILRCPENTFSCGNRCISEAQRCDGVLNCSNRSDEEKCDCNLETHFHCGNNTSCIEKSKQCDGKVDCWDKSDETECYKDFHCSDGEISCGDGQCVHKSRICDGIADCEDKTDEPEDCQK